MYNSVMLRALLWIVVAVAIAVVGYRLLITHPDARARDAAGHCLLRARVYTFGEGAAQPRRVFGIQNLDEADWNDVKVTIDGTITTGPNANQPTGAYEQALPPYDSTVPAHKVREIPLDDFKSPEGPAWVALTMRIGHAQIAARIGAESCTFDTPVPQPQ